MWLLFVLLRAADGVIMIRVRVVAELALAE